MLERIREIRMSERRLYQKITDIYALITDYDSQADITQQFLPLCKTNCIGQFLDVAEIRARNHEVMNMKDWDKFLV